jgi:hypothetical protein
MMPPNNTMEVLPDMKPRKMRKAPTTAMKPMRYCNMFPVRMSDPPEATPPTIGYSIEL